MNEVKPMAQAVQKIEQEPINLLDVIRNAASNPAVDVDKMERLMAMHERIVAKQAEADFNKAMRECQIEMGPIATDAANPQTKSKYASYPALDAALRPVYTKHGFNVTFDSGDATKPEDVRVVCLVGHDSGHTRTLHLDMPADGKGAKGGDVMTKTHATGAGLTYGRRYLLLMAFNLVVGERDDDGNSAGGAIITAEQKDTIIELIKETNADTTKFLAYVGAPTVDEIPAKKYKAAVAALEKKRNAG